MTGNSDLVAADGACSLREAMQSIATGVDATATATKVFHFFGNSDGDGTVSQLPDLLDMITLPPAQVLQIFDFNDDGFVSQLVDFREFRNRFGFSV